MTTMNTDEREEQPDWNIEASDKLLDNWPIRDVLVALAHAATHLLTDHDCDTHGYEELQHAVVAARCHADLLDSQPAGCGQCGGPHDFDTSVPSAVWNQVIRARGLSDYLCTTCIVREFVRVKQGFTAQLWNEEFYGVNIEVIVEGRTAQDAALVQDENNSLRNRLHDLEAELDSAAQGIVNEAGKVAQLMQAAATRMRDLCAEKLKALCLKFQQAADSSRLPNDLTASRDAAAAAALARAVSEIESLTLDQEQENEVE